MSKMKLNLKLITATERCFLDEPFAGKADYTRASALRGERLCFQIIYADDDAENTGKRFAYLKTECPDGIRVTVRRVESVPVRMPTYINCTDRDFLRTTPGLYPDLLRPLNDKNEISVAFAPQALWVDVEVSDSAKAGDREIRFVFTDDEGERAGEVAFTLHVIGAALPKQKIKVTQWIHYDCLATYYGVEVFSEKHWQIMENFIRTAVKNGINMILTPVFTPPLDTAIGGERPTVQLVDMSCRGGKWSFGFEKLERFVKMCLSCGAEYFEIAHIFTQWGAKHAPKIMAETDEGYRRVFGWDTDSAGEEYQGFLRAFIPALRGELERLGVADRAVFHLSDEPGGDHLPRYLELSAKVAPLFEGAVVMDALSDYEFYEQGAVKKPIVSTDHIQKYIDNGVENLWCYYCCCQVNKVSNRLIAMPGWRNRVIGMQLYKYAIEGFLQWGYNFYYSQYSKEPINPYAVTDGDFFVPAGDAFSVYPASDGTALETMHLLNFTQALYDLRAMELCQALCGRDAVMAVIEPQGEVTFTEYPKGDAYITAVREKINALIEAAL